MPCAVCQFWYMNCSGVSAEAAANAEFECSQPCCLFSCCCFFPQVRYQSYVEAMTLRHEFTPAATKASDLLSPSHSIASMSSRSVWNTLHVCHYAWTCGNFFLSLFCSNIPTRPIYSCSMFLLSYIVCLRSVYWCSMVYVLKCLGNISLLVSVDYHGERFGLYMIVHCRHW